MTPTDAATTGNESLTRPAVGLAAAAVLVWLVLAAIDHDGAAWLLQPVLGLAAAVTAWRAGGRSPQNMPAFVALIIGVVAVLVFFGWLILDGS